MRKAMMMAIGPAVLAGGAWAADPVAQRIDTMKKIDARAAVLAAMAEGRAPYDARKAAEAAAALAALSITIPQEYEVQAEGGKSRPEVWSDSKGFAAQADRLFKAAQGLKPGSADEVKAGSAAVQATCTACHDSYKLP